MSDAKHYKYLVILNFTFSYAIHFVECFQKCLHEKNYKFFQQNLFPPEFRNRRSKYLTKTEPSDRSIIDNLAIVV